MDVHDRAELPEDVRDLLVLFRNERGSGDRDLWQSIAAQMRRCELGTDQIAGAFCELVSIDLREAWSASGVEAATIIQGTSSNDTATGGGRLALEDYLVELPELCGEDGIPSELVLLEYEVRSKCGQPVDPAQFERRFPKEWPTVRSQLMQTLVAGDSTTCSLENVRDAGRSATQTGQSFPHMQPLKPGSRGVEFGDYELLHEIARGGMGVVYKARQTKLNRVVAVKMILAGQLASDEHVRRFYSEAESAAKLDHPGIVPIYEVGKVGEQHFFSMGFVDGAGLADRVSKGPLSPQVAATLVKAIAEATAYAHDQGVVHRDLKPQNILLTPDGNPKITDFGLAKTIEGDSNLTASGQILGTPSYMPPEQAAGRISEIGPVSDVYSLGAVLYCLLTGRPPFQSPNVTETLMMVMSKEPVSPRLLSPTVDRDLETICLKCLEKNPARRLKSAHELADELGRYLKGEPIRSRRVGLLARVGRWCRRNPLPVALSTAVLVLIGLGVISWMLALEAARTKKFAKVKERFQQVVDVPELTETYLKLGESILNEMSEHDRVAADAARERLHSAFINQIDTMIRKPKLEQEQLTQLGAAIALVDTFHRVRAGELKKLLDQRLRNWVTLFDLKPPFADLAAVFDSTQLTVDQGRRLIRSGQSGVPATQDLAPMAAAIRSKDEVVGDVRMEAVFDAGWHDALKLGVACVMNGAQGYAFILQRGDGLPKRALDTGVEPTSPVAPLKSARSVPWVLRLMRNGVVLREQFVESSALTGDSLRLLATRKDDQVTLQVNDLPALVFDDAFALSRSRPGGLGLIVPSGVGLTRLTAARLPRSAGTNPLDRGDELYSDGQFEDALAQYQEVAVSDSNVPTLQEARFKQANCLSQLGRKDEATDLLMQLFTEPGDRWPMLAGTSVWVSLLREKKTADAEGIYERLSTQYPFERLAALVTDEMRREILEGYRLGYSAKVVRGMSHAATLVRDAERMWIVQKQLQSSGPEFEQARSEVYQAYLLSRDLDKATRIVDEAYSTQKSEWAIMERVRLFRLKGQPEEALRENESALFSADGQIRRGFNYPLLMDHIRCRADLKQWDQVEKDIREFRGLLPSLESSIRMYLEEELAVVEGLLLSKYGDQAAAIAAWRAGLVRNPKTGRHLVEGTSEYHLLRSLSGDLDSVDASLFLTKFEGPQAGKLGTVLQTALSPEPLAMALRNMWNSPRGQDWIDQFAFWQLMGGDEVRLRLILFSLEYIRLNAFAGQMTTEQSDLVWDLLQTTYESITVDGTLTMSQMLPLALAWKGNTTMFAWDAGAATLTPRLRGQFAYLLAHRFLQLGRPQETIKFLKIAQKNAPAYSSLESLSKSDLELLEKGVGLVRLRSQTDQSIQVNVTLEGRSPESVDVQTEATLRLPSGVCALQIASPLDRQLRIATPQIDVVAGRTTTVEIESPWDSNPRVIPLPGLVPTPAQISGARRWQLVARESPRGWSCARINPNHTTVAVGGRDGNVRLWDVASRQYARILPGQLSEVSTVAWHPREPRLAIGAPDGTTRIWNAKSGEREVVLRGHLAGVASMAWSPDGRHLITGGGWGDGSVRLWSETGNAGPVIPIGGHIWALSWSPDSKMFATVGTDRHVRIWNLQGHLEQAFESPDPAEILAVAWSPDGQTLATGGHESKVRLWNVHDQIAGPTFSPTAHGVFSLAWDRDGSRLVVGTHDGYVAIHDAKTLSQLHRSPQSATIMSVQWSPDFQRIFTTGWDYAFRFWTDELQASANYQTTHFQPAIAEWSPDQRHFVVNDPGQSIELREPFAATRLTFPKTQPESATIVWSPDSRWVGLSLHQSHTISIWNASDGSIRAQAKIDGDPVTMMAWNSDSSRIAMASSAKVIQVMDLDGKLTTAIADLPRRPIAIGWQPKTNSLSVGFEQVEGKPSIQHFELETMKTLDIETPSYGQVQGIRWSSTGKHFATIHGAQAVVWDSDGKAIVTCIGHTYGILDMNWSPDGQTLATASWDQTARLWNLDGRCVATLTGHRGPVERIHWGIDGRIMTSGGDQTSRGWNDRTGQLRETTLWLPERNAITIHNSGEVLRRTPEAKQYVAFVIEQPRGEQLVATTETLTWDEFERIIGLPLERPPTSTASLTNQPPADASRPENSKE